MKMIIGLIRGFFILLGAIITIVVIKGCATAPIRIISFLTTDTTEKYMQRLAEMEDSKRMGYLKKHEKDLEYTRFDDAFVMIDIERLGEMAYIYICSYEWQEDNEFTVNEVSLTSNDGETIYYESDMQLKVKQTTLEKIEGEILLKYSHDGEWFYEGNQLTLTIEIEHKGKVKTISYPMEVKKIYSLAFPS